MRSILPKVFQGDDSAQLIDTFERRQGLKIGLSEEIAYRLGYIDAVRLEQLGANMKNQYGRYLLIEREGVLKLCRRSHEDAGWLCTW